MIYLDSSIVFSVHSTDANTLAAVSLLQLSRKPLVLTQLCEIEFINVLYRRVFCNEITHPQARASIGNLESNLHAGVFRMLPFPETAFKRGKVLAQSFTPSTGVRTADILHVAAALELGANSFYTFDRRQHKTAKAAGLMVNPLP